MLVAAGCGTFKGSADTPAGQLAPVAGVEKPEITVGTIPIIDAAPLYLAADQGLFAQAGLKVTLKPVQSGEFALPALSKGDFDFLFTNYVSLFQAQSGGMPVKIVAEASRSAKNAFGVVVRGDSKVTTPLDLVGKRIAVNALNNIAMMATTSVLQSYGIRPDQVRWVEYSFPEMPQALQRRDADAAFMAEPYLSQAELSSGVRTLFDPAAGWNEGIPTNGYAAMADFTTRNPNTIAAFRAAIREAQQRCADRSVLESVLTGSLKIPTQTAAVLAASTYPVNLNVTKLQQIADLMVQYHVIDRPVNVKATTLQP